MANNRNSRNRRGSNGTMNDGTQERYMIDEDEMKRLGNRVSHMEVFSHIQNANRKLDDPEMRLRHCCYIQSVAKVLNFQKQPSPV